MPDPIPQTPFERMLAEVAANVATSLTPEEEVAAIMEGHVRAGAAAADAFAIQTLGTGLSTGELLELTRMVITRQSAEIALVYRIAGESEALARMAQERARYGFFKRIEAHAISGIGGVA